MASRHKLSREKSWSSVQWDASKGTLAVSMPASRCGTLKASCGQECRVAPKCQPAGGRREWFSFASLSCGSGRNCGRGLDGDFENLCAYICFAAGDASQRVVQSSTSTG